MTNQSDYPERKETAPKQKHTPGPWVVESLEERHNGYTWPTFAIRNKPGNHCLATVGDVDRATAGQNQANARLIAAAPEMLELLKYALADLEGIMPDWEPSGDRTNPAWKTIDEIKTLIASIEKGE